MRVIILSCVMAVVIAYGSFYLLDGMVVDTATSLSSSSVRL